MPAWLPVFGVIFPAIVGGGVLVLPIALAPLGLPIGVAIVIAIGVVNMLTIAGLATAFARSSASLPLAGRLGALVTGRLGGNVGALASVINLVLDFGFVIAYCLGLSSSLSGLIGGASWLWAVGIIGLSTVLVLLQRRRVLMAAGTAVSFINIVLLAVMITVLAIHIVPANLTAGPSLSAPGSPGLTLVLGAVVTAYYGHSAVATVAPMSMQRDPSGRMLVTGCVTAMAAALVINTAWLIVTIGSAGTAAYTDQMATGIDIVRTVGGPAAGALATCFVLLALGMSGIVSAFVVGDLVVERLPFHRTLTVDLTPGTVLEVVDGPLDPTQLAIRIRLSPDGRAVLARASRGGRQETTEIPVGPWHADTLATEVGGARRNRWLHTTTTRTADAATLLIDTTMMVSVGRTGGSAAAELLDDTAAAHALVALTRSPLSLQDLASRLDMSEAEAEALLMSLRERSSVEVDDDGTWSAHLGRHRVATSPQAAVLAEGYAASSQAAAALRAGPAWLAASFTAHVAAAAPLLLAGALVLVLGASGGSFAGIMSLLGIAIVVFMGTALPALLNASSRRRADTPITRLPFAPGAWTLIAIAGAIVILCAVYAVGIYQRPLERIVAAATVVTSLWAAGQGRRRGAFRMATTVVAWVRRDRSVIAYAMAGDTEHAVEAPERLPLRGSWAVQLADPPVGDLRVLARDDSGAAADLGVCDVTWPGGEERFEPRDDLTPHVVGEPITSAPVTVTWAVR